MSSQRRTPSAYCICIATLDQQGQLDETAMHEHFARIAEAGVGIYAAGPPAEGWTLSPDEVLRILSIALEAADGRVPVRYMGVEPRQLREAHAQAELSREAGVDAFQVYSLDVGHGQKPSRTEIEVYFRGVLDASDQRCVLSSHYYEGYVLDPRLMQSLAEDYPHLVGFNVTNPEILYLAALLELLPEHAEVHVGGPMQALEALALGASGYLSTISNIAPALCQSVVQAWADADYEKSHAALRQLLRLKMRIYASGGNPPPPHQGRNGSSRATGNGVEIAARAGQPGDEAGDRSSGERLRDGDRGVSGEHRPGPLRAGRCEDLGT